MIGAHEGGLVVQSQVGKGSRFRVYLPACQEVICQAGVSKEAAASPKGQGQRLLVVDDEPAVREVAREALKQHSYQVAEDGQGQEALDLYARALAQGRAFDLVLLDLAMPVMDGKKCLEKLKALDPGVRVLVATGHSNEQAANERLAGQVAGVLHKPFDLRTLLDHVDSLLPPRP